MKPPVAFNKSVGEDSSVSRFPQFPSLPVERSSLLKSKEELESEEVAKDEVPAPVPVAEPLEEQEPANPVTNRTVLYSDSIEDPIYRTFVKFLEQAVFEDASDIHFVADEKVKFRLKGDLVDRSKDLIPAVNLKQMIYSSMTDTQKRLLESNKEIDYGLRIPNVGRFRVNAYTTQGNIEAVLRVIKEYVSSSAQLNLPPVIESLASIHDGLVLIAGATGSGKSTTLAAMINYVNENLNKRIFTVEDPIEIVHSNKNSVISQREVGEDTVSYNQALKSLLRQNPDIILIGEIRDKETATSVLQAAQTGHLVLSTIHASSAEETVSRFSGLYPAEERSNIKRMLSYTLKGVVAQRLIVDDSNKKIPVMEIMTSSIRVRESILADAEGITEREPLSLIIREEAINNMNTLDQYLIKLVIKGSISAEQAIKESANTLWIRQELQNRGLVRNY